MKKHFVLGIVLLIIAIVMEITFLSLHAFAVLNYGMFSHIPPVLLFFIGLYFLEKYKKRKND